MRPRWWLCAGLAGSVAALVGSAVPASAGHGTGNPPLGEAPSLAATAASSARPGPTAIRVVVVKSYSNCGSDVLWDELNGNWSSYGSTPITIDYSNPNLCGDSFTLADLEASGADVVILDDPSGISKTFSVDEVNALQTYAGEGHELIGTYLTFAWSEAGVDNSALAPLFGLPREDGWTGGESRIIATYRLDRKLKQAKPLFRHLPKRYVSNGYNASQTPADGTWDKADMAGAKIVGVNGDRSAAITLYRQGSYNAIYVASMPEYGGGQQDAQFLYNAITYSGRH